MSNRPRKWRNCFQRRDLPVLIRLLCIREAKRRSAKRLSKDIPEIPAPLQQNLWPLLEEILKAYPEAEFVQLQINLSYMKVKCGSSAKPVRLLAIEAHRLHGMRLLRKGLSKRDPHTADLRGHEFMNRTGKDHRGLRGISGHWRKRKRSGSMHRMRTVRSRLSLASCDHRSSEGMR